MPSVNSCAVHKLELKMNQDNIFEPLVEFVQDARKLLAEAKRPDVKGKLLNVQSKILWIHLFEGPSMELRAARKASNNPPPVG
jgi:hypothetical protein